MDNKYSKNYFDRLDMASKLLALPLSGRKNIVDWLNTFRTSGLGLKQSALDSFDQGNNYTSNAKIDEFNKKVEILVKSMKAAGIDIGATPKGRYSITARMLKSFTPPMFSDALKNLFFDPELAKVDFADKNAPKVLEELYTQNKRVELDNMETYQAFADHDNIPAIEWLIKTYGAKNYRFMYTAALDAFLTLVSKSALGEDKIIDMYIANGVIGISLDFDSHPFVLDKLKNLSIPTLKRIIPLIKFREEDGKISYYLFNMLDSYQKVDDSLISLFPISDKNWMHLVNHTIDFVGEIKKYEHLLLAFIKYAPYYLEEMLKHSEWRLYEEFLGLLPEVRDIFIF